MCIAIYLSEHPIAYRIPSRIPAIPDRIPYAIPYGNLWTHRIPYIRPSILYMPCICIIKYEQPVESTTENPLCLITPVFLMHTIWIRTYLYRENEAEPVDNT